MGDACDPDDDSSGSSARASPAVMRSRRILAVLAVGSVVSVLCHAHPLQAQPSADQVLADLGFSADGKQRVLSGDFVTDDVTAVSERGLSMSIAFLVKTSPESLSKQIHYSARHPR